MVPGPLWAVELFQEAGKGEHFPGSGFEGNSEVLGKLESAIRASG